MALHHIIWPGLLRYVVGSCESRTGHPFHLQAHGFFLLFFCIHVLRTPSESSYVVGFASASSFEAELDDMLYPKTDGRGVLGNEQHDERERTEEEYNTAAAPAGGKDESTVEGPCVGCIQRRPDSGPGPEEPFRGTPHSASVASLEHPLGPAEPSHERELTDDLQRTGNAPFDQNEIQSFPYYVREDSVAHEGELPENTMTDPQEMNVFSVPLNIPDTNEVPENPEARFSQSRVYEPLTTAETYSTGEVNEHVNPFTTLTETEDFRNVYQGTRPWGGEEGRGTNEYSRTAGAAEGSEANVRNWLQMVESEGQGTAGGDTGKDLRLEKSEDTHPGGPAAVDEFGSLHQPSISAGRPRSVRTNPQSHTDSQELHTGTKYTERSTSRRSRERRLRLPRGAEFRELTHKKRAKVALALGALAAALLSGYAGYRMYRGRRAQGPAVIQQPTKASRAVAAITSD